MVSCGVAFTPEQRKAYRQREDVKAKERLRDATPERRHKAKAGWLLRDTGWTWARREAAWAEQDGRCNICSRASEKLNCDHEHSSKKPRALLCQACNLSLGYYEKWQRPAGLVIEPYERYLARW